MFRNFNINRKGIILLGFIALSLTSCHRTTLEDQAENMANKYTERYCPTPVQDMQRTDSVTFDRKTHTLAFYFTLTDKADDPNNVDKMKGMITKTLLDELKENTNLKVYKDAGYNFRYIFRSQKNKKVLYEKNFSKRNYK